MRAWRAWERSGEPVSQRAWMAAVARREAARWISGPNGRAWSSSVGELPEPPDRGHPAPAAGRSPGADEVTRRIDVRRAVDRLPADDRVLVAMRYRDDLTQAEIARATGLPEGTVKVRLHRARAKLRLALA